MDKIKVLKTNGSLMKVRSIAECSLGAFCNTFELHLVIIGLENQYLVFFLSGRLRQVLLYNSRMNVVFIIFMAFKAIVTTIINTNSWLTED